MTDPSPQSASPSSQSAGHCEAEASPVLLGPPGLPNHQTRQRPTEGCWLQLLTQLQLSHSPQLSSCTLPSCQLFSKQINKKTLVFQLILTSTSINRFNNSMITQAKKPTDAI